MTWLPLTWAWSYERWTTSVVKWLCERGSRLLSTPSSWLLSPSSLCMLACHRRPDRTTVVWRASWLARALHISWCDWSVTVKIHCSYILLSSQTKRQSSDRYDRKMPDSDWWMNVATLKSTHRRNGSQWGWESTGVIRTVMLSWQHNRLRVCITVNNIKYSALQSVDNCDWWSHGLKWGVKASYYSEYKQMWLPRWLWVWKCMLLRDNIIQLMYGGITLCSHRHWQMWHSRMAKALRH